jgi:CBS-domain-containing membrane protein
MHCYPKLFYFRNSDCNIHRLLSLLPRINNQNDMIDNAIRVVRETEDVSLEIERELARNREKINASREKVSLRCTQVFCADI